MELCFQAIIEDFGLTSLLIAVIENYTANTRFCLICNYVNKIIPALQSRCTRFRFCPLASHHIRPRLQEIATAEGLADLLSFPLRI
jgi:DNA polymerase III delta prime subunit